VLPLVEPLGPCPGCESDAVRGLHVYRQRKPIIPVPFLAIAGCLRCGLLFTLPRPSQALLDTYYNPAPGVTSGWRNLRGRLKERELDRLESRLEDGRGLARRAVAHLLDRIARAPGQDGDLGDRRGGPSGPPDTRRQSVLDFGCGGGECLDAFAARDWETTGVEPNAISQLAARRHRIVPDVPAEPAFDFVVANQVLEHLIDPGQMLKVLARATRDGGYLFCSVPDVESLPDHGDLRYVASGVHINGFTPTALQNLLKLAGWMPLQVFTRSEWATFASADGDANVFGVLSRLGPAVTVDALASGALEPALAALRQWGRQLDVDGKFQGAAVPSPTTSPTASATASPAASPTEPSRS
jgi:2-polyprenyl-3-methyl-5-hydroxy-6-metoxy-1,4-benzoquinol methylase